MKSQLLPHIIELRNRLIICISSVFVLMLLSYTYYDIAYNILAVPFDSLPRSAELFYIQSVIEGAVLKVKFSFIFGIVLSIPVFIFHIVRFSLPGLKKNEVTILVGTILTSTLLSITSFVYGYFVLLPISIDFLMSPHFIQENVGILLNYSNNLLFVFNIIAYLIIIFQFPILLFMLLKCNFLSRTQLVASSRYIIVGIFIGSALLTPPDVISQILLSIPLILLLLIVILISKIFKVGQHV